MSTESFECKRCGYKSCRKCDLKKHLKRVNPCPPLLENIDNGVLLKEIERVIKEKKYKCDLCDKMFTSPQCKYTHKTICKGNPTNSITSLTILEYLKEITHQNNELASNNVALLEEIKDLKNKINTSSTTTNNTNNIINETVNNITMNVELRDFGCENMEAIPLDLLRNCFLNLEFNTLFENLHCDPDFPENHNIRIKSVKRELLEIYRNKRWNVQHFIDGFKEVLRRQHSIFREFIRTHYNLIKEDMDDDEINDNEHKLESILKWVTDPSNKRMIHEAKQVSAVLESYKTNTVKHIPGISTS